MSFYEQIGWWQICLLRTLADGKCYVVFITKYDDGKYVFLGSLADGKFYVSLVWIINYLNPVVFPMARGAPWEETSSPLSSQSQSSWNIFERCQMWTVHLQTLRSAYLRHHTLYYLTSTAKYYCRQMTKKNTWGRWLKQSWSFIIKSVARAGQL